MTRRLFLYLAGSAAAFAVSDSSRLMLSAEEARTIKSRLTADDKATLQSAVAKEKKRGPWSVMDHRPTDVPVPANEYYSEGPYWWPDPKNPSGPYIRRDGVVNPNRYDKNRKDIGEMSTNVLTLGMGAYFLDDGDAAKRAAVILRTWFLDPKTRMNPNMEFSQAIRGRNTGRGAGVLDSASLIQCVQGMMLLDLEPELDKGLHDWFREYLHWMNSSKNGLDEKKSGNNHASWWTAQYAAYATFVHDQQALDLAYNQFRQVLLKEFQPDGSAPREDARTKSLSYTTFNLDALSTLCRIAQVNGVDLWHVQGPQNVSMSKAIAYATPFVLEPATWKKEQIIDFESNKLVYPALAAVGLQTPDLWRDYHRFTRANTPWLLLTGWVAQLQERSSPGTPK